MVRTLAGSNIHVITGVNSEVKARPGRTRVQRGMESGHSKLLLQERHRHEGGREIRS